LSRQSEQDIREKQVSLLEGEICKMCLHDQLADLHNQHRKLMRQLVQTNPSDKFDAPNEGQSSLREGTTSLREKSLADDSDEAFDKISTAFVKGDENALQFAMQSKQRIFKEFLTTVMARCIKTRDNPLEHSNSLLAIPSLNSAANSSSINLLQSANVGSVGGSKDDTMLQINEKTMLDGLSKLEKGLIDWGSSLFSSLGRSADAVMGQLRKSLWAAEGKLSWLEWGLEREERGAERKVATLLMDGNTELIFDLSQCRKTEKDLRHLLSDTERRVRKEVLEEYEETLHHLRKEVMLDQALSLTDDLPTPEFTKLFEKETTIPKMASKRKGATSPKVLATQTKVPINRLEKSPRNGKKVSK